MTGECTCPTRASHHRWLWTIVLASATACVEEPPPRLELLVDGPTTPRTYAVRLDTESSDPGLFELVEGEDAVRVRTGPAGIAYREDDSVLRGDFSVEATFVQYAAPVGYREAYGIFVGGRDLDGPELEYTYLLVRPTGDFLIKRRIGEIVETLVDWSPHVAVRSVEEEGDEPQNTLGIDVIDGDTRFLVNGALVHSLPASRVRPYGIAGLRINHRLDVRVGSWSLGPLRRES